MSTHLIPPAQRRRVGERARWRCGYCLTSQRIIGPLLEIDHLIPEARGGTADDENLWLACPLCNSHKGDRILARDPTSQDMVRLFNPRDDIWSEHFEWIEDGVIIQGRTAIGRATVAALCMNHPDAVSARRMWVLAGWHPPRD
jgi:hypothetical protein